MEKINPEEPTKKLDGEQLDEFNTRIKNMTLKQLKIARSTMNGLYQMMRLKTKAFSNSEDKEMYARKLKELEAYESQVRLFDYYISKKKEE